MIPGWVSHSRLLHSMRVGGHAELLANHRSNTLPDKKILHKSVAPGETKEAVRRSLSSRIVLAAITLAVLLARPFSPRWGILLRKGITIMNVPATGKNFVRVIKLFQAKPIAKPGIAILHLFNRSAPVIG